MKKQNKKVFALGMAIILTLTNAFVVCAEDSPATLPTEAVYDLEQGGTQTFNILNEDGENDIIIVEEIPNVGRVAAGTYKVSYKSSSWNAGFYVKISSNQITSAYSPFHTVINGEITQSKLVKNSNTKATYSFLHRLTIFSFNTGVVAQISDSKLMVSKK